MIAQGAGRLPQVKTFKWSWLFYGVIALIAIAIFAFATFRPIQVLPRITLAPGFILTDQDGRSLTNEDLRGQIVLYNFTYTRCQAPCAQTSPIMRAIQDQLAQVSTDGVTITLVTISFDSQHDKPDTLCAYANSLGADTVRWRFLTGDATRVKYVIGSGFNVYYNANPSGVFEFDPVFVLVDGWGIIRATYRTLPTSDRIVRDMGLIVQEIKNSTGVGKYAYEAAHLFLCYPP